MKKLMTLILYEMEKEDLSSLMNTSKSSIEAHKET